MIVANFGIFNIEITGHADTAAPGQPDLVCAAVSGIVATYVNGLYLYDDRLEVTETKDTTIITLSNQNEYIAHYTGATINGLKMIEDQYPKALIVHYDNFYGGVLNAIKRSQNR